MIIVDDGRGHISLAELTDDAESSPPARQNARVKSN